MGLVLVKKVTCNICNVPLPANDLEHHRRWDCKWTVFNGKQGDNRTFEGFTLPKQTSNVLRQPGVLAPSQEFKRFKTEVEFTSML